MNHVVTDIETVPISGVCERPAPTQDDPDPFPPLVLHVPIVIGCMEFDNNYMPVGAIAHSGDERQMLEQFTALMGGVPRKNLVTWNGRTFDVPIIVLRCLHHGIQMSWYYQQKDMRYRFSEVGHHDVMDGVSDFGAARNVKLDHVAKLIGLPGKVGVDGSQVEGLWKEGRLQEIEDYCMSDVAQTAFVWLRYQYMRDEMSLDKYRAASEALLARLEKNPRRYGAMLEKTDRRTLFLRSSDEREQADVREAVERTEGELGVPAHEQDHGRDREGPAQDENGLQGGLPETAVPGRPQDDRQGDGG